MFAEDPLLVNCNIFGMVLSDNNWRGQSILVRSLLEEQRGIKFCKVYNTSGKGKKLQTLLEPYETNNEIVDPYLLVDNVLHDVNVMEDYKRKYIGGQACVGVVLFSVIKTPEWIIPLFQSSLLRETGNENNPIIN